MQKEHDPLMNHPEVKRITHAARTKAADTAKKKDLEASAVEVVGGEVIHLPKGAITLGFSSAVYAVITAVCPIVGIPLGLYAIWEILQSGPKIEENYIGTVSVIKDSKR